MNWIEWQYDTNPQINGTLEQWIREYKRHPKKFGTPEELKA